MANKVIRSGGSMITSTDDAKLLAQLFTDGLFNKSLNITLGTGNVVHIPELYGIIQGRDFTLDAQDVALQINPQGAGIIVVKIDLSQDADNRVSVVGYTGNHTIVYEDLNGSGEVAEMKIATYSAAATYINGSPIADYPRAVNSTNSTVPIELTIKASGWSNDVYTYTNPRITNDSLVRFAPGSNITKQQYIAGSKSMIIGTGQSVGKAFLKALNGAPTIDIPAKLIIYDMNSTYVD